MRFAPSVVAKCARHFHKEILQCYTILACIQREYLQTLLTRRKDIAWPNSFASPICNI